MMDVSLLDSFIESLAGIRNTINRSSKNKFSNYSQIEGFFPTNKIMPLNLVCKSRIKVTPPATCISALDERKSITYQNFYGSYNVQTSLTLLKLKSIERELLQKELQLVRKIDKSFVEGFVHEDIINCYLKVLCDSFSDLFYVVSNYNLHTNFVLEDRDFAGKRLIFIPVFQQAMILVVADMTSSQLLILNPLREMENHEVFSVKGEISCLSERFYNFHPTQIDRKMHQSRDLPSCIRLGKETRYCSVMICVYARIFAESINVNLSLLDLDPIDMDACRIHVYDAVAGHCFDDPLSQRDHCRNCKLSCEVTKHLSKIQCSRCSQTFHMSCLDSQPYANNFKFVCPPLRTALYQQQLQC